MAAADLGSAEWERSKISSQDVNLLKKLGISKKPKALCFPSEESYPTPPMGYRVSFVDHLIRGLSAPIHPFLRGLIFVYDLQLHHLTPNSILHISIFITLCEAFLGVSPNWALWKRIFFCCRNGSPNVAYNIGGVVISVRPTVDYFDVKLPDSVQGWRKKWLYIQEENHGCAEDNIPPFDGAEKILRRRSWDAEATEEEKTSTEALMTRIHELQDTRGEELSGIQITAYFLRIRVQPLQARKNPLWKYAGEEDADRLSVDLEVKDLEKLVQKISSLSKKDSVPSSCRVKPYSATNALPKKHPNLVSLPPLPEGGEVEERAVVTDDNQDAPSFANEPADSRKSAGSVEKEAASEGTASAQSPPPAVSPKNKRKRNDVEDSGTSKPEEAVPSHQKAAYDPYLESLISSDDEEETPTLDVAARTSTSHTLVVSEPPIEGEESSPPQQNVGASSPPSSPLVPSPKRARTETIPEPTLQLSSSSIPLLDDPMIKELIRIGAQFIGYREYASKTEEKLAAANERANTLAQKLERSEEARKKAESDTVQARAEADKAKTDAAGVEDLRKRLHDAETTLSEHIAAQAAREEAVLKRIRTQNRRFVKAREGIDQTKAGLSRLFPYFFPKKEEPATFLNLAKCFNPPEDLGLKMRQENMKVAVENTVALVADSQQTIDWAKVGDTEQIEQQKWRSLIKAAKPNTKKILSYLGIKPSSTPSSSKPELIFDNYTSIPGPSEVFPSPPLEKTSVAVNFVEESVSKTLAEDLKELQQQLQYVKKQSLMLMEQSRKSSEKEKVALQQAQDAIIDKDAAIAEAATATSDTSPTNPSKEIFSELDEINAQGPILPRSFQKSEDETKRGHEGPHPRAEPPWPRALWCGALVPPLDLPFRLLKASVTKPPVPRATIRKTFQRRTAANPISGEIASGTLPERGFISRRTLHRHGRLRSDE
ncbi:hypothetical protein QYE76_035019 [Lolium multiflorum]|uniref:Transposase (putative) gypsy type domain-containing protein n=1 Tax=Lolium multiflorum TaxID=4521 RepID=A0AAD8VN24_LOLMU|nr:hypothetical protein QYE76_035019 [Lolium multiflorum]